VSIGGESCETDCLKSVKEVRVTAERLGAWVGTITGLGCYALVIWALAEHFIA
jgi:hypothetical protein